MKKRFKRLVSPVVAVALIAGLCSVGNGIITAAERQKIIGNTPVKVVTAGNKTVLSYVGDIVDEATVKSGSVASTKEQTKYVPFSVDLKLDNEQLDKVRDELEDGMELVYTCSFAKSDEYPISVGETDSGDLLTATGEDYGDYEIITQDDTIDINIILDGKSIYDLEDVACGCKFALDVSSDAKKHTKTELTYEENEDVYRLSYIYDDKKQDEELKSYEISKVGEVEGNTITYTIDAVTNEAGVSLAGNTITDMLPDELDFVSASAEFYDENGVSETEEVSEEAVSEDVINYVIPDRQYNIKEVVLTIKAVLTSDKYIEYVENSKDGIEVNNTVSLYAKDSEETTEKKLLATAEDTSKIFDNTEFFAKSGAQAGYYGHSMQWELKGNTYFTYCEDVYVVDYIPDTKSHVFSNEKPITITYDNYAEHNYKGTLTDIGEFESEEYSYDNMSIDTIKSLELEGPSYYTYGDGQVLIIPLDSEALNSPFTIKYYTDIIDITDNLTEGVDISNSARILWGSAKSGDGIIGTIPEGNADVTKTLYFRAIKKTVNGDYNPFTQKVKFDISINECGNLLGESDYTIVTDDLTDEGMEYTGEISTVLKEIAGDGLATEVTLDRVDSEEECRNREFSYCISEDNKILHVNLGNVDATENYIITVETKVTSPEKLAMQKTGLVLSNTASVEYGDQIREATASLEYSNRLISKENVADGYDYAAHGNKWKFVVNPYNLPLENIKINDNLPDDTSTVVVDIVEINDREYRLGKRIPLPTVEGTTVNGSFEVANALISYTASTSNIELQIKPLDDSIDIKNDRYDIYYTTELKEDARISEDYVVNGVTVENKAVLTGDIEGVPFSDGNVASIEVSAKQNDNLVPVTKSGKETFYNEATGVFETDWSIELNRDSVNFAGYTVSDILAENLELYPDTFKVYEAKVASDGSFEKGEQISEDKLLELVKDYDRFSFKIGSELARTPLVVEFTTAVSKITEPGEQTITNAVSLVKNGKSMVLDENITADSVYYTDFDSIGYASGIKIKLKRNEVLPEETTRETQEETTTAEITTAAITTKKNEEINATEDTGVLNENITKKPEILATEEENTDKNKNTGVIGAGLVKTGDDSVSPVVMSIIAIVSLAVIVSLLVYMSNQRKRKSNK